jgi:hypothetical protein
VPGIVSGPFSNIETRGPAALAAATIPAVRQLPEQCSSCGRQIATLETCVLPDGTEKRGVEVTFRESTEGGIRCVECAKEEG